MIKEKLDFTLFDGETVEVSLCRTFYSTKLYHNGKSVRELSDGTKIFRIRLKSGVFKTIALSKDKNENILAEIDGQKVPLLQLTEARDNNRKRYDLLFFSFLIFLYLLFGLSSTPEPYDDLRDWSGEIQRADSKRVGRSTYEFFYLFTGTFEIRLLAHSTPLKIGDEVQVRAEYNNKLEAYKIRALSVNGVEKLSYGDGYLSYVFEITMVFMAFVITLLWGLHRFKKYKPRK